MGCKMTERRSYKVGQKVLVEETVNRVMVAHIVSPTKIKTDGRGIPTNVQGAYKPVDWKHYVAVQYVSSGLYDAVTKNSITPFIIKTKR
jgi:hypothetical protein